jgi:hypothetical protein
MTETDHVSESIKKEERRMRRLLVLVVALATALAMLVIPAGASDGDRTRTYKVTITNLTDSQMTTPMVVATHSNRFTLFRVGREASHGLQQVAENGAVPVLVAELEGIRQVADVGVAGMAPVPPGESVKVLVEAPQWAPRFSVAGMLICTNDGFGGISAGRLPGSGSVTFLGRSYDAGTEINTEAYEDLVPPCDGLGQTGETNPALAENGVVHLHQGIQGIADLDPALHGWTDPVIKIVIERVPGR